MKTELSLLYRLCGTLLFSVSSSSFSQQAISDNASGSSVSSRTNALTEQQSGPARAWTITPRVSLTETLTDNVNIGGANNGKQSDLISELAPGISISARTPRLKGYFDYTLRAQFYAKTDNNNRTQNALNTFGTFEAVDNWLFLDFSGIIAQQSISAFGAQSPSSGTVNANSTETATYRLSPYIRGQFAGKVDYLLRYDLSTTNSNTASASNVDVAQWIGQLKGSSVFRNLDWTVDGNQQTTDYSNGRKTDAELARLMLTYTVQPQLRISLSGGWESNNYASLDQESRTTHGYGFDWNPTERTQLSAFKEHRFFGDAHRVMFNHRFPMSSISFSDTRDVSVLPNQFATAGLGTVYDLFYPQFSQLCRQQLGDNSSQPQIDTCVLGLFNTLNVKPNTQVTGGFLTSRATIQRRQQLSFALFGARNSITLLANRSESQSTLPSTAVLADDFSQNTLVRQQGLSLTYSHSLSQLSNLNVVASRQESTGSGASNLKSTTNLYQVNMSTKLGAKTTGSVSLRRSEFNSDANSSYTENALIGTLSFIY